MRRLFAVLLAGLLLIAGPAHAWRQGSGWNEGDILLDQNSLNGDPTTGLYLDPNNDNVNEVTIQTDGRITAGVITYPATDGAAGEFLTTDGLGTLSWADVSTITPSIRIQEEDGSPGGRPKTLKVTNGSLTDNADGTYSLTTGGTVAGSNMELIYNSGGAYDGAANATWNSTTDTLTITGDSVVNNTNQDAEFFVRSFDNGAGIPYVVIQKSDTDTIDAYATTDNMDWLGILAFKGVDAGTTADYGAWIYAYQNGTAGTRVPTRLYLETCTNSGFNSSQLVLNSDGNVGVGSATPAAKLDVNGSFRATTGQVVTTLKIPFVTGDVTCANAGEIAIDTAQAQLAYYDGTREVAIPSIRMAHGVFDLTGWYTYQHYVMLVPLDSDRYPDGLVITEWEVNCLTAADPTTELDANLKYCDDIGTGTLPGANPVLIDVLDTTTGNSAETNMASSDLGSGAIPTGKTIYIEMDADPTDTSTLWEVRFHYYIPES